MHTHTHTAREREREVHLNMSVFASRLFPTPSATPSSRHVPSVCVDPHYETHSQVVFPPFFSYTHSHDDDLVTATDGDVVVV